MAAAPNVNKLIAGTPLKSPAEYTLGFKTLGGVPFTGSAACVLILGADMFCHRA